MRKGKDSLRWIKSRSKNARDIRKLMRQVERWRHSDCKRLGLTGYDERYDFFSGCFGNPNAKVVFVAEIASSAGLDKIIHRTSKNDLWKTAWGTDKAAMLKEALIDYGLIKREYKDNPQKWGCWITNFVKCAEIDSRWKMRGNYKTDLRYKKIKEKILAESAGLLSQELKIIKPDIIVFVGNDVEKYFKKFLLLDEIKKFIPYIATTKIIHYSAHVSHRKIPDIYRLQLTEVLRKWP